jgi:arylformamidase
MSTHSTIELGVWMSEVEMSLLAKSYTGLLSAVVFSWLNAFYAFIGLDTKPVTDIQPLALAKTLKDIHYAEGNSQVLDIYGADNSVKDITGNKKPILLYVHGGGWSRGDKKRVDSKPDFFTKELGYIFISMNYRLADEAKHPAQIEDVAAALRWLTANAARYGGDASRISLMGHSAGGHLVALTALRYQSEFESVLKNVIVVDTACTDLVSRWRTSGFFMRRMIRNNFSTDDKSLLEASPSNYIDGGAKLPRFLLLAAGRESSTSANKSFESQLRTRGAEVVYRELLDLNHMQINRTIGEPGVEVTEIIEKFF